MRWFNQHRTLKAKFDAVHMRHLHLVKVNAFDVWLAMARRIIVDSRLL